MDILQKIKGTGTSNVWADFNKVINSENQEIQPFVVCKTCQKLLSYPKGCSPLNLKKHSCHKRKIDESSTDEPHTKKFVVVSEQIRSEILQSCVKHVTHDLRPFEIVNGEGFKKLARSLVETGVKLGTKNFEIDHILPHPTTVSRQLQKVHAIEINLFVISLRPVIEKGKRNLH